MDGLLWGKNDVFKRSTSFERSFLPFYFVACPDELSSSSSLLTPFFPQCMMETDKPSKCAELREDYFECLHHRKEVRYID